MLKQSKGDHMCKINKWLRVCVDLNLATCFPLSHILVITHFVLLPTSWLCILSFIPENFSLPHTYFSYGTLSRNYFTRCLTTSRDFCWSFTWLIKHTCLSIRHKDRAWCNMKEAVSKEIIYCNINYNL